MKFSVLIPTRNRLQYLRYAIESVLQQEYEDWEVIIYDNDSEEDYEEYINSLSDSRIKYYRTSEFCAVTDNWNNALEKSSGDYVIMLGDDDCLLKDYFKTCKELIDGYNQPDLIYHSAYQYIYPKVMEYCKEGKLEAHPYAAFLVENNEPFFLDREKALLLVKKIMDFNVIINFNAQHSLLSRGLINMSKKHGNFYQSPYPDYYATTASFIQADRILIVPSRMTVIGVTPKSFGYHYFNNQEKLGTEFLKNTPDGRLSRALEGVILPGTNMNTSWLCAMEMVKRNYGDLLNLKVNYKKYRMLQVFHCCKQFICNEGPNYKDLLSVTKKMSVLETSLFLVPFAVSIYLRVARKSSAKAWATKMAYKFSHPSLGESRVIEGSYENILDVFNQVDIKYLPEKQAGI